MRALVQTYRLGETEETERDIEYANLTRMR